MTRVLVVDDRADNRYLLRTLLVGHGFEVDEARHGREALEGAARLPPDLVITDLLMPEMDGYALLREWRAQAPLRAIPVIVYTATYTDAKDEELALRLGAVAFLVKPMEPGEFLERVRQTLQGAVPAGEQDNASRQPDDEVTLELYNEVLVRKLEARSEQLERRIAELSASKSEIERLGRRHAVLSGINQAIVHMTNREELLEKACRVLVEQGGLALAWIGLVDAPTGHVIPAAWSGPGPDWFELAGPFDARRAARTPVEMALGAGRIYVCNDVAGEPLLAHVAGNLRQAGFRSVASCPVHVGADTVGAVTLYAAEPDFFDAAYSALVTDVAADISFALVHAEHEALRRHSEEELKHLNEDLEGRIQDRTRELMVANEELRTFSSSVSHDLRAPLSTISGFTSTVLARYAGKVLDEAGASSLKRVLAAAARMSQLTDDLLKLAQVSRHELARREVSLTELSLEVVSALREADRGRDVQITVQPGLRADADPGLVRIVLENLIGNSWKFTSRTPAASIEVGAQAQGGEAVYFVRDNGSGFDMQHASMLFTPFQRLHHPSEFEGTGIGLSIVSRIVAKHGGRVWADAKPGQGAVFRFTLHPAAERPGAGP